ncbi:hypothetical protein [Candidatus Poriferisocius sp.]|uniref:hypothetical protein n=1 Tax=Candidatus Poriferisocius sp. TaxID=3101276 RepID=UPI003B5B384C
MSIVAMDADAAFDLAIEYQAVADEIDRRRQRWVTVLEEVDYWLGQGQYPVGATLGGISRDLRIDAEDISQRAQTILLGPEGLNLALWAIDILRTTPEAWGGDDIVSRRDLEAFATRTDDLGEAARILLTNRSVFTMLDTAQNNRDYLSDPMEGFQASGGDGRISLDDLDAFEAKMSAYTTLLPYLATIDTAAQGDPSKADRFLSKADFETIAADVRLPPEVREAAAAVIAHGAYHRKDGFGWDDVGFWAMEAAGVLPVVGEIVDTTRALYALSQGDWKSALMFAARVAMPLGSGKTLLAARALVEMGRRRAHKEMLDFTLQQSARKARTRVAMTARRETTSKVKETYNKWRDDRPAGYEYLPPRSPS